jgi:hypothetical protein
MAKRRPRRKATLIQRSRSVSPQVKAMYHNVIGAGRSRVKREFFDLGSEDAEAITALLETRMDENLSRGSQ